MTPERPARTVVVAGGTRGLGRAVGVAFGREGDRVLLTHRWGSAHPEEIAGEFARAGARPPEVVEADVARPEDTGALLERVGPGGVDVLVANVCVTGRGDGTLSERTLLRSLDYSAWPLVRYVEAMEAAFGRSPRYVVATSSDGPDRFYPGYDYVAASKAVLEALCRRLAAARPGIRVNALRARQVDTAGYREMFGEEARGLIDRFAALEVDPGEVASAAVALCSGDLDGLSGEVLTVDRGAGPLDNLVTTAPVLLGLDAEWSPPPPERRGAAARRPGILWIDAGVAPGEAAGGLDGAAVPLHVVSASGAECVEADRIPGAVVLGCDWTGRDDEDVEPALLLHRLLARARRDGAPPRYAVRVERSGSPAHPGQALAETLDRYQGAWHLGSGTRWNAVRYAGADHRDGALGAVRALLSGALDGVRGQVLTVGRGLR